MGVFLAQRSVEMQPVLGAAFRMDKAWATCTGLFEIVFNLIVI